MKLISFKKREDFGTEIYAQIFYTKRWALLQVSVSWNDFPGWPYLQIKSGTGSLLSILFWVYKFGFDVGLIERTWDWERLEALEDEDSPVKLSD
jgi:hypothetical protein